MQIIQLDTLPVRERIPGYFGKFIHAEKSSVVFWDVRAGAAFPEHRHVHEQITFIAEGSFELTVNGKPLLLEANTALVIPSNTAHAGRALTDCKIIDTFTPVREEYK